MVRRGVSVAEFFFVGIRIRPERATRATTDKPDTTSRPGRLLLLQQRLEVGPAAEGVEVAVLLQKRDPAWVAEVAGRLGAAEQGDGPGSVALAPLPVRRAGRG